jgi:glutamate/tyrosine decarboxylase-like PLP-dependent enzyme
MGGGAMRIHGRKTEQMVAECARRFVEYFFSDENANLQKATKSPDGEFLKGLSKRASIPEYGRSLEDVAAGILREVFDYGDRVDHTKFFSFIPAPASKISWLGEVITSAYNRFGGVKKNFPTGNLLEQVTIDWLCSQAGYGGNSTGLFVTGGSMANLTGLIAARDSVLGFARIPQGTAYVSDQTHSSVIKAFRIIGIPDSRVRVVETDDNFRMRTDELEKMIEEDEESGLVPFAAVATAGTTNSGSVDPLKEISRICGEHGLWMHTDGAFGASVVLSERHRSLMDGIELSDSISWDAHKWLFQTYSCGIILVKDRRRLFDSFNIQPEYMASLELTRDNYNPSDLGIELTRPPRGIKLWLTLQAVGRKEIERAIDRGFELSFHLEKVLRGRSGIEVVSPAQLTVINFRFAPDNMNEKQRNELNQMISDVLIEEGESVIFTTELKGKRVLRMSTLNPETTEVELEECVDKLCAAADRLCKDMR